MSKFVSLLNTPLCAPRYFLPACIAVLMGLVVTTDPGFAQSLGERGEDVADDLDRIPELVAIVFYIIGIIIVGFGILKFKRHSEHGQQVTLGSAILTVLVGVGVLMAPTLINALIDTFGGSNSGVSRMTF